jgi:hypothetical protein
MYKTAVIVTELTNINPYISNEINKKIQEFYDNHYEFISLNQIVAGAKLISTLYFKEVPKKNKNKLENNQSGGAKAKKKSKSKKEKM